MKDFINDRKIYARKAIALKNRKKALTEKIDKEIERHRKSCNHELMFLIYSEMKDNNFYYFPRLYCYRCGRSIILGKLNNKNYSNIIDCSNIIDKIFPKYVNDKYKTCFINAVIDKVVITFDPTNYKELASICKSINDKLLEDIDNVNSYSDLMEKFNNLILLKKKSLKK